MARKKVVSVTVIAQEVDAQGRPTGPVEVSRIDTLDKDYNYRIRSVFWGEQSVRNLWAPYYHDNEAREFPVRVDPNSPLTKGRSALAPNEALTPQKFLTWWESNEDEYVLCKGANCQPCNATTSAVSKAALSVPEELAEMPE